MNSKFGKLTVMVVIGFFGSINAIDKTVGSDVLRSYNQDLVNLEEPGPVITTHQHPGLGTHAASKPPVQHMYGTNPNTYTPLSLDFEAKLKKDVQNFKDEESMSEEEMGIQSYMYLMSKEFQDVGGFLQDESSVLDSIKNVIQSVANSLKANPQELPNTATILDGSVAGLNLADQLIGEVQERLEDMTKAVNEQAQDVSENAGSYGKAFEQLEPFLKDMQSQYPKAYKALTKKYPEISVEWAESENKIVDIDFGNEHEDHTQAPDLGEIRHESLSDNSDNIPLLSDV